MIEKHEIDAWIADVYRYCSRYDIPAKYLVEIVSDPKVIPMIRGKAFEYSAMLLLRRVLPAERWIVDKVSMNAAFGFHDMDVRVIHIPTRKVVSVECKLAKKGGFSAKQNDSYVRVKCMRSRTLGDEMIEKLSHKTGIPQPVVKTHNDQYLPTDFDVVMTSIANAFYETEEDTGMYLWQPKPKASEFLKGLLTGADKDDEKLQQVAFEKVYLAQADDLTVKTGNTATCSRKSCHNKSNCGFIPNYPLIHFSNKKTLPERPWYDLADAEKVFLGVLTKPTLKIVTLEQLQKLTVERP